MTLAQLNEHLDAVQQLARTEETLKNFWDAAVPGAQKLTGMPRGSGVRDRGLYDSRKRRKPGRMVSVRALGSKSAFGM